MLAPSDASAFSGARYSSERCSLFGSLPVWSMVYQRRKVTAHSNREVLCYNTSCCARSFSRPLCLHLHRLEDCFRDLSAMTPL
jgi:hypothetical protein